NLLKFLPNTLLSGLLEGLPESVVNLFPTSFKDYPKKHLAKIVLKGMKFGDLERQLYWMRTFFIGENNLFEKPDMSFLSKMIPNLDRFDKSRVGQVVDFYTYLRDDFLVKTDRASMLNSLEVRVPYLDNNVLAWAFSTREPHLNLFKTKLQLRKLLESRLPEVAKRPKKGFGIPLKKWLRNELKDFAYTILMNKKLENYVEKKKIKSIWTAHQKGKENNAGAIWMLVMLSGWLDNWV
ncbi:MAG: Asparagine synthetase, partial [Candidatus Woesebacteria bacterium GW2011_GWA1_39_12]